MLSKLPSALGLIALGALMNGAAAQTPADATPDPRLAAASVQGRQQELANMPLPADIGPIEKVDMPIYVMEFHIWYTTPYGALGRPGHHHGGANEYPDTEIRGPDWMRERKQVSYPLVGPYNSEDPEIIRWQLRCLAATGVDGVFVHGFPDWNTGLTFAWEPLWARLLDIAAEEGVKVAIHDEAHFQAGRPSQSIDGMARRAGEWIRKYGNHAAYLKIDGKPAYTFQYWNFFRGALPLEDFKQVVAKAKEIAGQEIFWIPYRGPDSNMLAIPEVGGTVILSNSNSQFRQIEPDPAKLNAGGRFPRIPGYTDAPLPPTISEDNRKRMLKAIADHPDKMLGLWLYPGFDSSPLTARRSRTETVWLPRNGGKTLANAIRDFAELKPGFLLISSWNDYEEATALEPQMDYEGTNGDPYLFCRILAAFKGKTFVPPPLPAKESVDPYMWQPLYGIDRTPPVISDWDYRPLEPGVTVTVVDSGHAVAEAVAVDRGDAWLAVGADGTVERQGMTPVKPIKPAEEGGITLLPNKPLEINIDPAALAGEGEVFAGVELIDAGRGHLHIEYPVDPPFADSRPTDEKKARIRGSILLYGHGQWRADTRMLRSFPLEAKPLTLKITFVPDPRATGEVKPPRLGRVNLFRSFKRASGGVEVAWMPADSNVKTFRFNTPPLDGPIPRAVYILATDAAGNRTVPRPLIPTR